MMDNFYHTISVVIPCYNCSDTIVTTTKSILAQKHLPNEIILIDDGSTDNTLQKLNEFAVMVPKHIKCTVSTQVNSGPSVARNLGVTLASSHWIAFLDSDDYWTRDHLSSMLTAIKQNIECNIFGKVDKPHGFKITLNKLLLKNYFQTSSTVVSRQMMLKFPFCPSQKYSEDFRTWLSIVTEGSGYLSSGLSAYTILSGKQYMGEGLSSRIGDMQKGEIANFRFLYQSKFISWYQYFFATCFSYIKFFRRFLVRLVRR